MTRRKSVRQETALKTTLRITIIAVAASITGLVVLLILIFNFMKEERGNAAQTMAFRSCTTIQDTSNVLRGAMNQKIIGVVVETAGTGNPAKLTSMQFTSNGTSMPIGQNIENARLWYTATDQEFMPIQQVGSTIDNFGDKPFEITCNQYLQTGKNYFWLTFDIKPDAAYAPGFIDATCNEIRIGAITYKPLISAPAGKRFTEPNVPYYSMGNFPANNVNGWNSRRDGSGVPPKQINASRNSYFIQAGHRIISSTGASLQTVVVEKGGELKITSPLRLNTMNIACGGIVQQDVTVTDYYCFNVFNMENGANYIHNNTGYFPGLVCNLKPHSNQVFYQYGEATFAYHNVWGNVMIDASTPLDIDIQKNFSNIQGDLEIHKTGNLASNDKQNGIFCGGNDTLNIGGSLIISGGNFLGMRSKEFKTLNMMIGKNLVVKDGNLYDADFNSKGNTIFNVQGDVVMTGGKVQLENGSGSCLNFSGNGETRWFQKSSANINLCSVTVSNGRVLTIKGDRLGDIGKKSLLDVQENSKLVCNEYAVTGQGNFLLQDNASIVIGSKQGISTEGDEGNIRTKGRIFHSGANYVYSTSSQPQITGNFTTRPEVNTIRKLIIEKESSSQKVTLSQNLKITEQVMINKGELIENGKELKLPRITENQ
jgi:hypothetical protein